MPLVSSICVSHENSAGDHTSGLVSGLHEFASFGVPDPRIKLRSLCHSGYVCVYACGSECIRNKKTKEKMKKNKNYKEK